MAKVIATPKVSKTAGGVPKGMSRRAKHSLPIGKETGPGKVKGSGKPAGYGKGSVLGK